MDEARRYLRYVMPGVLYGVQTLILFWVALPDWTAATIVKPLSGLNNALAIALASIFVSGAIGYVFATMHHWLHWNSPSELFRLQYGATSGRYRKLLEVSETRKAIVSTTP